MKLRNSKLLAMTRGDIQNIFIRKLRLEDAHAFADLQIALSQETDFIPFYFLDRDAFI